MTVFVQITKKRLNVRYFFVADVIQNDIILFSVNYNTGTISFSIPVLYVYKYMRL